MGKFTPLALGMLLTGLAIADVRHCACDLSNAEVMATCECGLCRETEKQPADAQIFYLKDINPRKPNRTLALPRAHGKGMHALSEMSAKEQVAFWTAAIAKARELWGEQWGIAYNGDVSRTQCHTHVHIGKLLEGVELSNFKVVSSPAAIPAPTDGHGVWIHPVKGKLHVHLGEEITETVLLR